MTDEDFTVADLLAIQALVHTYPRYLDGGDLVRLGKLFDRAAVHFEDRDEPVTADPGEITKMFADFVRMYEGVPRTRHNIVNLIVTPAGPGRATATSTVLVVQQAPGGPLQPIITGDYRDTFLKTGGEWHFAERYITNDLFGDLSAHGKYAIAAA
ncbi:nuclear transport factor 2 family protein [Sphingopyxis sp. OPL5]|uniref:nuclear transport factor 2 family protein n=1 Tax=Sphingopyxis sp. OPL5 TaxID=2486273 RepID=UPI00164D1770|nr:nuclear transport factor 2 family protein [Sphingopyxis sp. OPL5]QNO27945.1 nuclear transport factor 2 family protein [Sphingopyxis sp. OPL5]